MAEFVSVGQPLLEAQVVDAADSLAYDTHDVEDALGAGLITPEDLRDVEFWQRAVERVRGLHAALGPEQLVPTVVRALINWQVTDLLEHTRERLHQDSIRTVGEVRSASRTLVGPGPAVLQWKAALEEFLHRRVYSHHRVLRMAVKGERILHELFAEFCRAPQLLPERYFRRIGPGLLERTVCDYLAGMTDRYAQDEHLRLFQPYTSV